MTSRFTLLAAAGLAGLAFAGCSGADEEGDIPPAPLNPPSGMVRGAGGTAGQVGNAGTGGTGVATAGTGGTGVTPTAGTGGTGGTGVAAGGTGGTAAGGAGGTGGGAIPVGTGFAITPGTDGWVAGASNGVGIQGSFYPFGDYQAMPAGVTEVTLDAFDTPTSICLSGTASQVIGGAFSQYYGGGVALNLADPGGGVGAGPWTRGAVTGFSFTITGPTIPPNIRFNASAPGGGDAFCQDDIPTAGQVSIQLGTLTQACYTPGGPALAPTAQLESIQWQVVTVEDQATPFDFCINNLTALTQ